MAEFKIDGRMKVKKLKELFKDKFQGTLRVYNGSRVADDNDTLAAIRGDEGAKGGSLVCRASRTVGKFIEDMWNTFGIKVKIASPDDWVLALDGITLSKLKDIPNNARKADMEALIAYKRDDDNKSNIIDSEWNDEDSQEVCEDPERNITVEVHAHAMCLRLCVVKKPEELEDIYTEDRKKAIELINKELGDEDSEFFEYDIYDWYIMRDNDLYEDLLINVSDGNGETIYEFEGEGNEFFEECQFETTVDYEDEEGDDLDFLKGLSSENESFNDYLKYAIANEKVLTGFSLCRKYLTGSYDSDSNVYYAGTRTILEDVCFKYNIKLEEGESFDIEKLKFFMDCSMEPDFEREYEGEWWLENILYGNKVIPGEWQFESKDVTEPEYMFLIKDWGGYLEKVFAKDVSQD